MIVWIRSLKTRLDACSPQSHRNVTLLRCYILAYGQAPSAEEETVRQIPRYSCHLYMMRKCSRVLPHHVSFSAQVERMEGAGGMDVGIETERRPAISALFRKQPNLCRMLHVYALAAQAMASLTQVQAVLSERPDVGRQARP